MVTMELVRPQNMLLHKNATLDRESEIDQSSPVAGEQALWRAVIVQALMDAASMSHKPENQNAKREALIWLRGTSEDFRTVCHYAGYDPDYIKMIAKNALARNCTWRVTPGMGERAFKTQAGEMQWLPTARR